MHERVSAIMIHVKTKLDFPRARMVRPGPLATYRFQHNYSVRKELWFLSTPFLTVLYMPFCPQFITIFRKCLIVERCNFHGIIFKRNALKLPTFPAVLGPGYQEATYVNQWRKSDRMRKVPKIRRRYRLVLSFDGFFFIQWESFIYQNVQNELNYMNLFPLVKNSPLPARNRQI